MVTALVPWAGLLLVSICLLGSVKLLAAIVVGGVCMHVGRHWHTVVRPILWLQGRIARRCKEAIRVHMLLLLLLLLLLLGCIHGGRRGDCGVRTDWGGGNRMGTVKSKVWLLLLLLQLLLFLLQLLLLLGHGRIGWA